MSRLKLRVHVVTQSEFANVQKEASSQNYRVSEVLGPQSLELRLRLTAEGNDTINQFISEAKRHYEIVNGVTSTALGLYDDLFYYLSPEDSMDSLTQNNEIYFLLVTDVKKAGRKRQTETNGVISSTPNSADTDKTILEASVSKKRKTNGGASPAKVDNKEPLNETVSMPCSQDKQLFPIDSSQGAGVNESDQLAPNKASKGSKDNNSEASSEINPSKISAPKFKPSKSTKSPQHTANQEGNGSAEELPENAGKGFNAKFSSSVQTIAPLRKAVPSSGSAPLSKTKSPGKHAKSSEKPEVADPTSEPHKNASEPSFNLLKQIDSSQAETNFPEAVAKVPSPVEPMSPQHQSQTKSDQDFSEEIVEDEDDSEDEEEREEARRADRVRRAKALSATRVKASNACALATRSGDVKKANSASISDQKESQTSSIVKPSSVLKGLVAGKPGKVPSAASKARSSVAAKLRELRQPELNRNDDQRNGSLLESGLSGFEALAKVRPTVHDNERRPERYQVMNDTQSSDEEFESSDSESDDDEGDSDESSDEKKISPGPSKHKRGGALSALRK